jgi:hypothetical protein
MTRRPTIGDNPLDSISASSSPSERSGARADDTHGPEKSAKQRGRATPPEPDREAPPPDPHTMRPSWLRQLFRLDRIRLVGGDIAPGVTRLSPARPGEPRSFGLPGGEVIHLKRDVVRIEVQSEEAVRRVDALLAWATAGAFLAGPLGALAGSLYGGRERRSTALDVQLHDGRHILTVTDPETAQEMQAELR